MRILVTKMVKIPENCIVQQKGKVFMFQGPKGVVEEDCTRHMLTFDIYEGCIRIRLWNANKKAAAFATTVESLLRNCIKAVTVGFAFTMKAVYNHFSINLEVQENGRVLLVKNFLGEKNIKKFTMRGVAKVKLGDAKDTLVIEGPSLPDVSQSAGTITNICKAKNRDSRIFLDGIFVIEKGVMA
jgi:large subunit ribosomal protein L9e